MYREIEGDLIQLTKEGMFDVITHGCNCFNKMKSGIAPQMAEAFGCDTFFMELKGHDYNKLGCIDYHMVSVYEKDGEVRIYNPLITRLDFNLRGWERKKDVFVVNSYTQYKYAKNHIDGVSKPLDYEALTLCLRKINMTFEGKHIGLPKIGAGLAGGDWKCIKTIIKTELKDCHVTVVKLPK